MYMPVFSETIGVTLLIVSTGALIICYSAGLIVTDIIIWAAPKTTNTLYKFFGNLARFYNHHITKIRQKRAESQKIKEIITQLTEHERNFLALFNQTKKPGALQENELLPSIVHNAGLTLAHKKILFLTNADKRYETFSIQPAVKRNLERIIFNGTKIKCLITLDLRYVQGNQSSGGGAPGSR